MSADQFLRAIIVMRIFEFTYEDLAFHISDSRSLRRFRAGIESGIFRLKRSFGLIRCIWKGF